MVEHVPMVLGINMFTIVAVILGILAVIVYFKGARPEKPWGAPLLALLVIGAVAAVICERMDVGEKDYSRYHLQSARLIGRGLKGKISNDARILIFRAPVEYEFEAPDARPAPPPSNVEDMENVPPEMRRPTVEERVEEKKKEWEKEIEKAAGVNIEVVGCEVPDISLEKMRPPEYPGDAIAFSNVLEEYRDEDIDAWISFVGLPRDAEGNWALKDVSSHDWADPPLVAADLDRVFQPDVLRQWFKDGLIDVAAIHPVLKSPDMIVITKETLDEIPEKAPRENMPASPEQ